MSSWQNFYLFKVLNFYYYRSPDYFYRKDVAQSKNLNNSQNPKYIEKIFVNYKFIILNKKTPPDIIQNGVFILHRAAKPVDSADISRCRFGAISVEKMDLMDYMDKFWLTPSRGWTVFSPLERIFSPPGQYQIGRF